MPKLWVWGLYIKLVGWGYFSIQKIQNSGEEGGLAWNSLHGGGIDIFWNYTISLQCFFTGRICEAAETTLWCYIWSSGTVIIILKILFIKNAWFMDQRTDPQKAFAMFLSSYNHRNFHQCTTAVGEESSRQRFQCFSKFSPHFPLCSRSSTQRKRFLFAGSKIKVLVTNFLLRISTKRPHLGLQWRFFC